MHIPEAIQKSFKKLTLTAGSNHGIKVAACIKTNVQTNYNSIKTIIFLTSLQYNKVLMLYHLKTRHSVNTVQ